MQTSFLIAALSASTMPITSVPAPTSIPPVPPTPQASPSIVNAELTSDPVSAKPTSNTSSSSRSCIASHLVKAFFGDVFVTWFLLLPRMSA